MNRLNHRLTGPADAPIVLFLHGFMGSLTDWQTVIDALEGEYRCLAVDLPGHGDSTGFSDSAYTMEGAARLVVDLLDELELLRRANVIAFKYLTPEQTQRQGIASGNPFSVRSLVYILAGHVLYHFEDLREKYLPGMAQMGASA